MENQLETYELQNFEELKAISDPVRWQMLVLLENDPMTSAQIARELSITRSKSHYHMGILEDSGLIKLHHESFEKGLLEKYYLSKAKGYSTRGLLTKKQSEGITESYYRNIINGMIETLKKLVGRSSEKKNMTGLYLSLQQDYELTDSQATEYINELRDMSDRYDHISIDNINTGKKDLLHIHQTIVHIPLDKKD